MGKPCSDSDLKFYLYYFLFFIFYFKKKKKGMVLIVAVVMRLEYREFQKRIMGFVGGYREEWDNYDILHLTINLDVFCQCFNLVKTSRSHNVGFRISRSSIEH